MFAAEIQNINHQPSVHQNRFAKANFIIQNNQNCLAVFIQVEGLFTLNFTQKRNLAGRTGVRVVSHTTRPSVVPAVHVALRSARPPCYLRRTSLPQRRALSNRDFVQPGGRFPLRSARAHRAPFVDSSFLAVAVLTAALYAVQPQHPRLTTRLCLRLPAQRVHPHLAAN